MAQVQIYAISPATGIVGMTDYQAKQAFESLERSEQSASVAS